jgi:hypothetical protein
MYNFIDATPPAVGVQLLDPNSGAGFLPDSSEAVAEATSNGSARFDVPVFINQPFDLLPSTFMVNAPDEASVVFDTGKPMTKVTVVVSGQKQKIVAFLGYNESTNYGGGTNGESDFEGIYQTTGGIYLTMMVADDLLGMSMNLGQDDDRIKGPYLR